MALYAVADELVCELGVDLAVGVVEPFEEQGFLTEACKVWRADVFPFGAGPAVDENSFLVVSQRCEGAGRSHVAGIGRALIDDR